MSNSETKERPESKSSLPSRGSAAALRLQIAELEEELRRVKRIARCPHSPIAGIGGTIQRFRHKKQLSIDQVSAASKVSKGAISRMERVANCDARLSTLERLAAVLGVKVSDLILAYESEKPQNDEIQRREPRQ